MTAAAKKVKTYVYTLADIVAHGGLETGITEWILERDITIIGAAANNTCEIHTAELAELGGYRMNTEISRAAIFSKPGAIVSVSSNGAWSAASDAPSLDNQHNVMFNEDNGIDIDDGETIKFLTSSESKMAALDTLLLVHTGIIYYLDR